MKAVLSAILTAVSSIKFTIAVLAMLCVAALFKSLWSGPLSVLSGMRWFAEMQEWSSQLFVVLLALFCINLVACIARRVPETVRLFIFPPSCLVNTVPASLHCIKRELQSPCRPEELDTMHRLLASYFSKKPAPATDGDHTCLRFERNRYVHFGFFLAHAGILGMAVGLIISQSGFRHTFEVREGQRVTPRATGAIGSSNASPLAFSILCEKVYPAAYDQKTSVKKHRSILSIINKQGKKVKTGQVSFGKPLRYSGFDIYQERFSRQIRCAQIRIEKKNGTNTIVTVTEGGSFRVPESDTPIVAARFQPHAVKLRVGSSPASLRVSQKPAAFDSERLRGYRFSLEGFIRQEAALIKLIRDPGQKLIWFAFLCMTTGFALSFFFSHEIVRVQIFRKEDGCRIVLHGAASKNIEKTAALFDAVSAAIQGRACR